MSILPRILHYGRVLTSVPNAPFLYRPQLEVILGFLSELGVTQKARFGGFVESGYATDDFCLYVHLKRGKARYPLLIDAHLDHPGFVLDGRGNGIAFGSVGFKRMRNLLRNEPIDLRIFGNSGELITVGKITDLALVGKPAVQIETPIAVPINSHGIWDVSDFEVLGDKICMQSADATAMVMIALALIEQIILSPKDFPDLDVTFVFSFLEEVFEVSASALAMRGCTPFGRIDNRWMIIVLECMEAIPLASQSQLVASQNLAEQSLRNLRLDHDDRAYAPGSREVSSDVQRLHDLYRSLRLILPDHDSGVAIRINDTDCVYGYEFLDQPNLAEILLLNAAEQLGVDHQHTLYGGACNGTAFSLFPTSSHIATVNIPNPYKHNMDSGGNVVTERIRLSDIEAATKILLRILQTAGQEVPKSHPRAISQLLKSTSLIPNTSIRRRLRAERGAAAWSAQWRLRKGRYFGENPIEDLGFRLRGGLARIHELVMSK